MTVPRLFVLLLLLPCGLASGFATLGPQADCQYRTTQANPILAALNDGHTDLRLVGNASFNGSFAITGSADVQIRGGFTDCAQAAANTRPANPPRSVIVAGASTAAAITLVPAGTRRRVITLDRVDLVPNVEQFPTGAGVAIGGLLDLRLVHSRISGFRFVGGYGGGVAMSQGLLDMVHSEISQNLAERGGGIHCASGGTVRLDPGSKLFFNQAVSSTGPGQGGGAYLDGCSFTAQGRVLPATQGGTSGIVGNSATLQGGGLAVIGGLATIQGGPYCLDPTTASCLPRLAVIGANSAARGGGIFAAQDADIQVDFANVSANTAREAGGGVFVIGSRLRFGGLGSTFPSFDRSQCPEGICEVLSGNRVEDNEGLAGSGGAIYANMAEIALVDALVEDNLAGTAHAIRVDDGTAILQQVLLRQPDDPLPDAGIAATFDQSVVTIRRSTLVVEPAAVAIPAAAGGHANAEPPIPQTIIEAFGAALTVTDSVIAGFGTAVEPVFLGPGAALSGGCNAHAGTNVPAALSAISMVIDRQAFADGDGYTPRAGSVLLDRCSGAEVLPGARDIRGQSRRVSQPGGAVNTPMDIGAVERPGELLFMSGFE